MYLANLADYLTAILCINCPDLTTVRVPLPNHWDSRKATSTVSQNISRALLPPFPHVRRILYPEYSARPLNICLAARPSVTLPSTAAYGETAWE